MIRDVFLVPVTADKGHAVLFSNDQNLCNKALVNGIKAFNHQVQPCGKTVAGFTIVNLTRTPPLQTCYCDHLPLGENGVGDVGGGGGL